MTDIVIPLSRNSHWHHNELRYCLRSIEKHLSDVGEVVVVGDFMPDWINREQVAWLQVPDDRDQPSNKNIKKKLEAFCRQNTQSDQFIYMNDDHFLLQDEVAPNFPYYSDGTIEGFLFRAKPDQYYELMQNTLYALSLLGHDQIHFDVHAPMLMYKEEFLNVMKYYDWSGDGFVIKSLYANTVGILKDVDIPDLKINVPLTLNYLLCKIENRPWFSIGDFGVSVGLMDLMRKLYPEKSKYEL